MPTSSKIFLRFRARNLVHVPASAADLGVRIRKIGIVVRDTLLRGRGTVAVLNLGTVVSAEVQWIGRVAFLNPAEMRAEDLRIAIAARDATAREIKSRVKDRDRAKDKTKDKNGKAAGILTVGADNSKIAVIITTANVRSINSRERRPKRRRRPASATKSRDFLNACLGRSRSRLR